MPISNNLLIGKFMGYPHSLSSLCVDSYYDWNSLMSVVDRIENVYDAIVKIEGDHCVISYHDVNGFYNHYVAKRNKLDATYKCVCKFIRQIDRSKKRKLVITHPDRKKK